MANKSSLKLVNRGREFHFNEENERALKEVFATFREAQSLPENTEFYLNGKRLSGEESVGSLQLSPGDLIDVVDPQNYQGFSSLVGKSVVVTGGSKGIGKGIARVFAKAGCKVMIVARNIDDAEKTAKELGPNVSAFSADVTVYSSMVEMVNAAVERHGGLDILCANAGIFPQARIEDMTDEQWDEIMNINTKGSFHAVKAAIPHLKHSSHGRIILTSSITGVITGYPGWSHYGASKSAQIGFLKSASIELAPHRITVNAVLPGNISTEALESLDGGYVQSMIKCIPLKRLGTVDEIGYAVLFLATPEASYITGQTIVVDGGQTLPESIDALN